jgi:hypothetical protein
MTKSELDELFRASAAGPIPEGDTDGTVIANPGTFLAKLNAKAAHLVAWQGKVFSPASEDLKNKITPFHMQRIRAQVYKEPSWVDGQECIVLDYSKTSKAARYIRDEIREVSPGVYLGVVFWGKRQVLKFALTA